MRILIIMLAGIIAASTSASAQSRQGCQPECSAEDALHLDAGSAIRADAIRKAQEDAEFSAVVGGAIPFAVDHSTFGKGAEARLDKAISWLTTHPERKATLAGHADDPGSDEYNLALGDRRANVVKAYMTARGITPARLSTVTFGRFRPRPRDAGGERNGRVEITLD